jgi:SAM-dependent methyltransferase
MGISMAYLKYLSAKGYLNRNTKLLDIGTSNLYNVTNSDVIAFTSTYGRAVPEAQANDLAIKSRLRPGKEMLYLSELIDLTDISYTSYDVCRGAKTEVFDLNRQEISDAAKASFDIVLNFGTSEHVINQLNTFRVIHDALKVGGIAFHQLPSTGWANHGYFCYHPRLFNDLRIANNYEEKDIWYTLATQSPIEPIDFREEEKPLEPGSGSLHGLPSILPSCNLHVIHQKVSDLPFRVSLELSTSHSRVAKEIRAIHVGDPVVLQSRAVNLLASVARRAVTRMIGTR